MCGQVSNAPHERRRSRNHTRTGGGRLRNTRHVRRGPYGPHRDLCPRTELHGTGCVVAGSLATTTRRASPRRCPPRTEHVLRSCPQLCSGTPVDGPALRRSVDYAQRWATRPRVSRTRCGLVRCRCDDVSSTRRGGRSGAAKRGTVLSRSCARILRRSAGAAAAVTSPCGGIGAAGYTGQHCHRSTLNGRGHLGRWTLQA